jgi:catechol 2,3-dioxygenase-like lactoylglutathione lyase family enzyme
MANEITIPALPCPSIDEVVTFYEALGFRRTYHQTKPNPYVVVRREDWEMHFFGMDGFDPETSYGTCVVQVPDTATTWRASR